MIISNTNAKELSSSHCNGHNYTVLFPENVSDLYELENNAFILGNGTNTIFVNKQKSQIVSLKKLTKFDIRGKTVLAETGVLLPNLINSLKPLNLGGLEFTYPIPTTLGGAIYQNFGAYEKTISELILEVHCFDLKNKKTITLTKEDCAFGYRDSIFKTNELIITSALLQLETIHQIDIKATCDSFKLKRESSYPLAYTLGSIFKNPPGLSAGKLIDDCGFKGYAHKTVMVCESHANVIVCNKESQSEDFIELLTLIQTTVTTKKNITLIPEIVVY